MELTIDCSTCPRQRTTGCDDCVVTFVAGRDPDEAVVVDAAEFAALRRLADAGLIPSLRGDESVGSLWITGEGLVEVGDRRRHRRRLRDVG